MNRREHIALFAVAGTKNLKGLMCMNGREHIALFAVAGTIFHNGILKGVDTHD